MTELINLADKTIEEITVVTNYDERSVEIEQGLFQHILGLQVEVVGRLIENQQIHRLQQQFENGKAGALTSRQYFHLLGRILSAKHECSQQIAYLVAYFTFGNIINGLEYGKSAIEQRSLVLGEITYLHIMSQLQFSFVLKLTHDTFHER